MLKARQSKLDVVVAGRLTGPKGDLVRRLIKLVLPQFPQLDFTVAGGPVSESLRATGGDNLHFVGWVENLPELLSGARLVIGSGRVALEAMSVGVPVLAIGEARYVGFVTAENFPEARRTNFGDCESGAEFDFEAVANDLRRFQDGYRPDVGLYPKLLEDYAQTGVAHRVEKVYEDAVLEQRLTGCKIPILCYHRVLPFAPTDSKANIYVTVDRFTEQLKSLRRRGFNTITFSDLLDEAPLPKRPIILTFDDGYRDNFQHLLPILIKGNAKAVVFALGDRELTTNRWDAALGEPQTPLMSDHELLACHRSGHIEIGAHSLSHPHLTDIPDDRMVEEVQGAKLALEALLGARVPAFAYPYGDWDKRVRNIVVQAGYSFALATDRGQELTTDRFAASRRLIFPKTDAFGFWKKSSVWYPHYRRLMSRSA